MAENTFGFSIPGAQSGQAQEISVSAATDVDVSDKATRDLGKVDIASLDQYTPNTGRLPVYGPLTDTELRATDVKVTLDGEANLVNLQGYRSSDTTFQPVRLDKATNTIQTIEYEHHEIHAGSSFTCHYNNDVTNVGEMTGIAFNTPNTTKWIHIEVSAFASGASYFAIYEVADLDVDEGTDLAIYNRDRNSLTASTVSTVETSPEAGKATSYTEAQLSGATLSTATEIMRKYIGTSGKSAIGGEARGIGEFILKQATQYAFVLVSLTADDVTHNITLDWYEHTNIA